MRLIDANALNARIDKCVGIDCLGLEPVMAIRDVKALISVMHTIDAIPVEWLENKRKEALHEGMRPDEVEAVEMVLWMWQKEQEAR